MTDIFPVMGADDEREAAPPADSVFEQLFREHALGVAAYAARRVPAASVQDVVADTFAVAWRRRDRIPADPGPWLLAVARRVIANHRRAARRHQALRLRLAAQPPEPAAEHSSALPEVLAALRRLPERDREVLLLAAWEGLTAPQGARVLGCSATAYRLRLHRARRRLTAAIEDEAGSRQRCVSALRPEGLL